MSDNILEVLLDQEDLRAGQIRAKVFIDYIAAHGGAFSETAMAEIEAETQAILNAKNAMKEAGEDL